MKKITLLLAVLLTLGLSACSQGKKTKETKEMDKVLVAFFSASGTTRAAAALLAVTIGVTKAARPSRTHDLPSDIISETTDTDTSAVTGAKGTTGTSSAAVTETYTTAAVTQSSKGVSEKTTSTKANVVTTKQTTARSSSAAITQTAATTASSTATVTSVSVSVTDITTGTLSKK